MGRYKSMLASLPLIAVIFTAIIALILLTFGSITQTFALIMILTLLSAYILDEAIADILFKEKFQNAVSIMEKNTAITEAIHKELYRQKVPCEIVDPCRKEIWEFEDELLWYNPPLILAEDELFPKIHDVYSQPEFKKAKYLFYSGGSEEDLNDFSNRIKRFENIKARILGQNSQAWKKMRAKVINDTPPGLSFFIGKKKGFDEGILYIMEKPFAIDAKKGEEPAYVFVLREKEIMRRLRTIFNNEWSKGVEHE